MKEKLFYLYLFLSIIVLLFTFTGCSSPTEPAAPTDASPTEPAAPTDVSKVIGPSGGIVEAANSSSLLYGIKVEVPPGALNTDSTISIETATINPSYNTDSKASSTIFKLESTNASYFNIPVTVTVPYDESLVDDESYIGLFIYNPSTNSWQSTTTYEIDTINNTISAATMHFSLFQVISTYFGSIGVNVDTGYKPDLNGFDIMNTGDWCFGMSAYSKWFFDNKSPDILYGFYEHSVARLVAEEAHSEITDFDGGVLGFAIDLYKASSLPYYNLYNALVSTRKPQVLGMVDFSPFEGHAVVAYAIQDGKVYIYDNRYPGVAAILTPNNFGSFLDYENFTSFILLDNSVLFTDFEDIYDKYFPFNPPIANFAANTTSITEGGTVNFSNLSTNSPTSWSWNFGDGGTSILQNPSHTYSISGTYTVSLTVANVYGSDNETKNDYISVTRSDIETGTLTDSRDGQIYKTVKIGNQWWMAENLNYDEGSSSYCYGNNSSNCNTYGRLYDWYTACNVCPEGWHLPTKSEWTILFNYLGGVTVAGGKMKETGLSHWNSPNTGATNESDFTALPSGCWSSYYYSFHNLGNRAYFWTSTADGSLAWNFSLGYNFAAVSWSCGDKTFCPSVRCVKD
ncbi:MAG: FISUMP domain-containing protein [Candidatus Aminicenantaceae bacterium]